MNLNFQQKEPRTCTASLSSHDYAGRLIQQMIRQRYIKKGLTPQAAILEGECS